MAKVLVVLVFILASCGDPDDLTILSIQVHSPSGSADSLRRFPPNTPLPERIQVQVYKAFAEDQDMLKDPVRNVDEAWEDLEEDPTTQKKYLLVTVRSNAEKDYTYVLRLASLVANPVEAGDLYVDECGSIGNIKAEKGQKVRLDIHTHLGDCSQMPCGHDGHCIGERYCLSFECQASGACNTNADCPQGAYCNDQSACDSSCEPSNSRCTSDYLCCGGICSIHCPTQ
jgi:hypothetical protein